MDTNEHESIVRRSFLIRENSCSFVVEIGIVKGRFQHCVRNG